MGIWRFCGVVGLLCLMGGCDKSGPQQAKAEAPSVKPAQPKILVVHSYHAEYEWVAAINRGLQMAMQPGDGRVEHYYMDTKRHTDEAWMGQSAGEVMELIEDWRPDVVVLSDDDAQQYVGRHLAGRERPAVVFCGVNADPRLYDYPASNVTGVLERPHFNESLAFFKRFYPDAEKVVFISDDSSTSRAVIAYLKTLPPGAMEVADYVMPTTFDAWKSTVEAYGHQVDALVVYTYHTVKADAQAKTSMTPRDVMAWTAENSRLPIIGLLVFSVDDGSLCGVLESGVEQGQLAGQLAVEILGGKRPADLPIVTGTRGQTMMNLNMAHQLGLGIERMELDSVDVLVGDKRHDRVVPKEL